MGKNVPTATAIRGALEALDAFERIAVVGGRRLSVRELRDGDIEISAVLAGGRKVLRQYVGCATVRHAQASCYVDLLVNALENAVQDLVRALEAANGTATCGPVNVDGDGRDVA